PPRSPQRHAPGPSLPRRPGAQPVRRPQGPAGTPLPAVRRGRGTRMVRVEPLVHTPLIDLRGSALDRRTLRARLPRAQASQNAPVETVRPLLDDIRDRGRAAVAEATARFDGVESGSFRVPADALREAAAQLDPAVRAGLDEAIARVRTVSAAEVPAPRTVEVASGARITTRHLPADRVGLYVPGGLAVYPSSVV